MFKVSEGEEGLQFALFFSHQSAYDQMALLGKLLLGGGGGSWLLVLASSTAKQSQ